MNAADILKYGHQTILKTIEGLTPKEWQTVGATSQWTAKDVMAHLASCELVLVGLLRSFLKSSTPTPLLDAFKSQDGDQFNAEQVRDRRERSVKAVVEEYVKAYQQVAQLAPQIPPATWRQPGTLPWYGAEYSLDDFVVYTYYGHKREHAGQLKLFLKNLRSTKP